MAGNRGVDCGVDNDGGSAGRFSGVGLGSGCKRHVFDVGVVFADVCLCDGFGSFGGGFGGDRYVAWCGFGFFDGRAYDECCDAGYDISHFWVADNVDIRGDGGGY